MSLGGSSNTAQAETLPSFAEAIKQKTGVDIVGDFNATQQGVELSKYVNVKFNGGFSLPPEVQKGMAAFGQELIDLAKQNGIDLKKTREFSGSDFDKDGKLSAQEVGAVILAASLDVETRGFQPGKVLRFDNDLSAKDTAKLLTPESKEAVLMVARQMLADSGVKVSDAPGDAAVQNAVNGMKPDTVMRC